MRLPRVAIDHPLAPGERVALPADTAHHLLRVLRLRNGAPILLFNGDPGDWHGVLEVAGKRDARVHIHRFEPRDAEAPIAITLVQGISRGQRMDYTLEKAVELGVTTVVPVVMERTQAAPAGERAERKARHWQGVLTAAAAQSGRTCQPRLAPQLGFRSWLTSARTEQEPCVLLDPDGEFRPASLWPQTPARMTLIAGPEGGFSPAERDAAYAVGCQGLRLGPRILRTETAAVAALTALLVCYGDMGV
ncbi:MAG: 16S rRNA (uracil(1498)-N(3))-methyltransferase [Halofilum sp. (in: g-proteobacteria)]